jgi:poly-gamma-glutamate synthesis protein (capsule biosynthesis protein)
MTMTRDDQTGRADDMIESLEGDEEFASLTSMPRHSEVFVAARSRAARRQELRREQQAKRRRIIMGVGAVVALALCFLLVRAAVGAAGRLFSSSPAAKDESAQQGTQAADESQAAGESQGTDESQGKAGTQEATSDEPVVIELAMVGDILQHNGVFSSGFLADGTRNYDHIFAHVGSELKGADLKVVNQETVLGGEELGFSGYPSFNGPQEMGDAEAKAGFNVVLRATNHAMDAGYQGLINELNFWKTKHPEVAVIGAINPDEEGASLDETTIYEKDGFTVALLNYTYDLNGYEDPRGAVSLLTEERVRTTVAKADEVADMVVVFPHWGEEYNFEPVADQRAMAQVFIDSGAGVIIGGHPHVIEPVEILTASDGRKVPCFWSVGNFVSTQVENYMLVGGVAHVTMEKAADGTCQVTRCSFVPTITHKGVGTDMTTYLLRDYTDDLAATNYLESNGTDNTNLTVAWAQEFCLEVLGEAFDVNAEQIAFGPEAFATAA